MNILPNALRPPNSGIIQTETPHGVSAIRQPDCAALIWTRAPARRFQHWIDELPPKQLPKARLTLRPDRVCDALLNMAQIHNTPPSAERNMLIEDASALAAIFADVMKAAYLRLRLDVVTTNACRKFHIDNVTARLVCTYRGTGTQYGLSHDGSDPSDVLTVPTGAPIILRGKQWPETPFSGLLHRSPPIEGRGETRLVLVLDPVAEPETETDTAYLH